MSIKKHTILLLFLSVFITCCTVDYFPKPKGYNRIDLPEHTFQPLTEKHPYTFEYSRHAKILPDSSGIAEPHWIDIYYPNFKANVQITYKRLKDKKELLGEHVDDSYKLANKHNIKAYSIDESVNSTPKGYTVTLFELSGEVPSQLQFFVTDSTSNFMRGALYFRTATRNDSLAPIIQFIKEDVAHLLNTLEWVKE